MTVASYKSANMSVVTAGNIKSGITIAGVSGQYPNSTYTLPSAGGATDLISSTFNGQITSSTAFEWWDSAGNYYSGAGNSNLSPGHILSGYTIFGQVGTVTGGPANCSSDGQTGCVAVTAFPAAQVANIATTDLRIGKSLAGLSGALKANCRNSTTSATYSDDVAIGSVDNNSDTTGSGTSTWDSIDDYNAFPAGLVTGWSNYDCGASNWTDVTPSSTCAATPASCEYKDNTTGLTVTKTIATSNTWSQAVQACYNSTYGGASAGYWRLPTQKEMLQLYTDGISSVAGSNFITIANMGSFYWSSTSDAQSTSYAWVVGLSDGYSFAITDVTFGCSNTYNGTKSGTGYSTICVH